MRLRSPLPSGWTRVCLTNHPEYYTSRSPALCRQHVVQHAVPLLSQTDHLRQTDLVMRPFRMHRILTKLLARIWWDFG